MFKNPVLKYSIFVSYIIFLLLISELILRTFFHIDFPVIETTVPFIYQISGNKKIGYELRPNTEDTNSAGFRDFEYSRDKNPDVTRIAVIGDSIAYGLGASKREMTYAKRLEMLLNKENKKRFEVLNFGVPGYGTVQIFERFKDKAAKYKPDIVIYGYWFNDFHRRGCSLSELFLDNASGDSIRAKIWELYSSFFSKHFLLKKIAVRILESQLFQRSYLFYYNLNKFFSDKQNAACPLPNADPPNAANAKYLHGIFNECVDKLSRKNNMSFLDSGPPGWEVFYEYWNAFHNLEDYCKKHSIRLILLLTPVLSDFSDYQYYPLHEFMHKLAESMGIEMLDALNSFGEKYRSPVRNHDLCHFDDSGHLLVAETIEDYLERNEEALIGS